MSESNNYVRLHGTAKVRKAWPANGAKQAMCFGGVRVPGDRGSIDVKCFAQAAEDFGNADDLTVTVEGKIGYEKPYPPPPANGPKVPWPMCIVVERVTVHAPRGHEEPPPPGDEDFA